MAEEKVFLNEESIYVSNTKIVLGGTTYATANITSVTKSSSPPQVGCSVLIIGFGVLGALLSYVLVQNNIQALLIVLAIFVGVAVCGVWLFQSQKGEYHVILSSSSGEKRGLTSIDEEKIKRVVNAIGEAITFRG